MHMFVFVLLRIGLLFFLSFAIISIYINDVLFFIFLVYAEGNGNSGGDCPVCLMPYLYPTVLPCGHMFCYLCIKGIVRSSSSDVIPASCPMCRSNIPRNITMKPTLYEPLKKASENDANEYKWFYQRRKKDG